MLEKEKELIILLIKYKLNNEEVIKLKSLLTCELNWGFLTCNLIKNKISGLVWKNLNNYILGDKETECTFTDLFNFSYSSYVYQREKGLEQENATRLILKKFDRENIDYVLLKGLSNVLSIYKDHGLRTFNDNDILVRKEHLSRVQSLLGHNNYKQGVVENFTKFRESTKRENLTRLLTSHELMPYVKVFNSDKAMFLYHIVDLHYSTSLMTNKVNHSITYEMLKNKYCQKGLYILNKEYSLLFLCEHFYKEAIYKEPSKNSNDLSLYKLCDVHYLILEESIDLEYIWTLAKKISFENPLVFTMKYVFEIFGNHGFRNLEDKINEYIREIDLMNDVFEYNSNIKAYSYKGKKLIDRFLKF